MDNASTLLTFARETLEIELTEAQRLLARLDDNFVRACELLLNCRGKAVISGIGKSGHIGKKIAASLASTGTPAFFLHPAEALHGDLGMIGPDDVMIFISYSGRAKELDLILPLLAESRIPVIAITGGTASPLAQGAACVLDISVEREACPMGLAPTSSAVNTLMIGDALAMALMRQRGFNAEDFARSHPGGSLGARLLNRVHHLMRTGDRLPKVQESADVMAAMLELSRTGLGLVAVCDEQQKWWASSPTAICAAGWCRATSWRIRSARRLPAPAIACRNSGAREKRWRRCTSSISAPRRWSTLRGNWSAR